MSKTRKSLVDFVNISQTYATNANIECRYRILPDLCMTPKDWIGIYRVGWVSYDEFLCFQMCSATSTSSESDLEAKVTFNKDILPQEDDGDFYQFCYVDGVKEIKGASTPFQIRNLNNYDFEAVEDPEDDIIVIKSKSMALHDDLFQRESQHFILETKSQLECSTLKEVISEVQRKYENAVIDNAENEKKWKLKNSELQVKYDQAVAEKDGKYEELQKKLAERGDQLSECQRKYDQLGADAGLIEKELRKNLADRDEQLSECLRKCDQFGADAGLIKEELQRKLAERDDQLSECLRKHDQLGADAGLIEKKLQKELVERDENICELQIKYDQYVAEAAIIEQKKFADAEKKYTELLHKYELFNEDKKRMEEEFQQEKLLKFAENTALLERLSEYENEKNKTNGSHFYLKEAYDNLKENLNSRNHSLQTLEAENKNLISKNASLESQNKDFKERLVLCRDMYSKAMAENHNLKKVTKCSDTIYSREHCYKKLTGALLEKYIIAKKASQEKSEEKLFNDAELMFEDCQNEVEQEQEEEKFADANCGPSKFCPVCYLSFPDDASEEDMNKHVDDHYDSCPVCRLEFHLEMSEDDRTEHVNTHL